MIDKLNLKTLFVLFFVGLFSCQSDDGIDCFPFSTIDATVNTNLPEFFNLQNPSGWAYVTGAGTGTRGLIVVNTGTGFRAYDRNSPHICPGENTTLVVVDDIQIVSPQDDARWILTSGQPLNDATMGRNLVRYSASANGNIIRITN